MKNKMSYITFGLTILAFYACISTKPSIQYPIFKFDSWKASSMTYFDSIAVAHQSAMDHGLTNQTMVREKIAGLNSPLFNSNLQYALNKNHQKKWDKMYVIVNSFEGEVIIDITTFLFENDREAWGYSYSLNLDKYRKVNAFDLKKISELRSNAYSSNNNILIISKFDTQFNELTKQMLIGPVLQEFEPVLSLYNTDIL
jgi:hypothetical protein